jgi:SRSO17 transposase
MKEKMTMNNKTKTKALRNMDTYDAVDTAKRRVAEEKGGLRYLAAVDFCNQFGIPTSEPAPAKPSGGRREMHIKEIQNQREELIRLGIITPVVETEDE